MGQENTGGGTFKLPFFCVDQRAWRRGGTVVGRGVGTVRLRGSETQLSDGGQSRSVLSGGLQYSSDSDCCDSTSIA